MVEFTQINCDMTDECGVCNGNGEVIWYEDEDGDGYGDINSPSEPSCLPAMGFVANHLDPDDTCENNHLNYDCDGNCIVDIDCLGDCGGDAENLGCGCDLPAAEEYYNCGGICINDLDSDSICDELEILGCTDVEAQNYNVNSTEDDESCEYLSIAIEILPDKFSIQSIYPNPFNPIVTITYGIPTSQYTEGHIYNLSGELVHTLISQYQSAGNYSIEWNAFTKPSGIYIFILKSESEVQSQKLVLLK